MGQRLGPEIVVSQYDAIAQRTLTTVRRKGGIVTLFDVSPRVYDDATGRWTGGEPIVGTQPAMQLQDDPKRFQARNLVVSNPLTLMIPGWNIPVVPEPGKTLQWGTRVATIRDVEDFNPDGRQVISYTVVAGV